VSDGTTILDLHGRLLRDTFERGLKDGDAFLLFTLFHTHQVELAAPVLTDRPDVLRVCALTQRCCAEALASLWSGCDDPRASPAHWYWLWNGEWKGYNHAENLTGEEAERLRQLVGQLEGHPWVRRVTPED
jgi:hypothetical protein